jgi:hypothetical protein
MSDKDDRRAEAEARRAVASSTHGSEASQNAPGRYLMAEAYHEKRVEEASDDESGKKG